MEQRPDQPPEGRLIAAALERSGLSIREASRRAGLSYGRWRQITSGIQHVSPGEFAAVRAPARTLAKMAHAVDVTPAQLAGAGREDAAAALEDMQRQGPAALTVVPAHPPGDVPADSDLPPVLRGLDPHQVTPFLIAVDRDLDDSLNGVRAPFDARERGILADERLTLDGKRVMLALTRMILAGVLGQSRNHAGSMGLYSRACLPGYGEAALG
jgi:hypothetical protein